MITSNGKAGSSNQNPGAIGFRPTHGGIVKVQPPRKEDLQPSYAQVLEGNETHAETHGWYGSMSTITPYSTATQY
jgi:erythrocyte band 7 integral membrane protein